MRTQDEWQPLSKRYQRLKLMGWQPSMDELPYPAPHWPEELDLLPTQTGDDWSLMEKDNADAYVMVEEDAGNVVFDLEEVR